MRAKNRVSIPALFLAALIGLGTPAWPTAAQEKPVEGGPASAGPAAEVGTVVLDDPLTGPAALWADTCINKSNLRQFVGEGLLYKVAGRCFEQATTAQMPSRLSRLIVPDGEIRLETKLVSGTTRTALRLWLRIAPGSEPGFYFVEIQPAAGRARLEKIVTTNSDPAAQTPDRQAMLVSASTSSSTLVERADLAPMFVGDGWNTVAVRLQGPKLWLLINDQVALSAVDATHATGDVYLAVARLGPLDDTAESAMLLRNLRVSRLAQGEAGREPIYLQPPTLGAVTAEDPLTGPGILSSGVCTTQRNRVGFVPAGFEMKATGRCGETSTNAEISTPPIKDLTLGDGDVRFDLKAAGALDRAYFRFFFRTDPAAKNGYSIGLIPGRGVALLYRWANNQPTFITGREDLAWLYQPADWNTVAVRVRSNQLWLLLNDQPVLFATDGTYGTGSASFDLTRSGDLDDEQEVDVVIRNLRVSALAD